MVEPVTLSEVRCLSCRQAFRPQRSDARTCSNACRMALSRHGAGKAFQARGVSPDAIPLRLCVVEQVTREQAAGVILRHEWLHSMPTKPTAFYGLLGPSGEVLGAVCFGLGPGTKSRLLCGPDWQDRTTVLERGACTPLAARDAPSHLIAKAVRLAARDHGWAVFAAYADPAAFEAGALYQHCNWLRLGASVGRHPPSIHYQARPHAGAVWQDERALRRAGIRISDARRLGWQIEALPNRQRFVTFCGHGRRAARAALTVEVLPWPKSPA